MRRDDLLKPLLQGIPVEMGKSVFLADEEKFDNWNDYVYAVEVSNTLGNQFIATIVASLFSITILIYCEKGLPLVCKPIDANITLDGIAESLGISLVRPSHEIPSMNLGFAYQHYKLAEPGSRSRLTKCDVASYLRQTSQYWSLTVRS